MSSREERRQKLLAKFLSIARERIASLSSLFGRLEGGDGSESTVQQLMREIHTLKGESRLMGFTAMSEVSHRVEDLLALARDQGFSIESDLSDAIYRGLDLLAEFAEGPERDALQSAANAFSELTEQVLAAGKEAASLEPHRAPPREEASALAEESPSPPDRGEGLEGTAAGGPKERERSALRQDFVRVPTETLGRLTSLCADLLRRQEAFEGSLRTLSDAVDPGALPILRTLRDQAFESHLRLTEVQETLRQLGLLEVDTLFRRYPPAIREIARQQGKRIRIVVEGGTVAVDKRVLDHIDDALLHLIRNSVDHGVESPEERERAGKPSHGTISLRARQVGAQVEIQVSDDGRGIDVERVRRSARQRQILSPRELDALSDEAALQLVFHPGLSTRDEISELSGRGVGLDVVKQQVEELGGSVQLATTPGYGTTFTLQLPISVSLTKLLVVEAAGRSWAIPSAQIEVLERLESHSLERSGEGYAATINGRRTAVLDLGAVVGGVAEVQPAAGVLDLVVVAHGGQRLALRVDRLGREAETVQRTLGEFLAGARIVQGAMLSEGGRPALVLNVPEILRRFGEGEVRYVAALPRMEGRRRYRVLIVDDSELTRDMLVHTALRMGFEIFEAVNGRDALETVESAEPDLVLTDLDMPVMDGIELIEALRAREATASTPIVVLSTRGGEEDRRRASEAGADAYLVKTEFSEPALREVLGRYLEF